MTFLTSLEIATNEVKIFNYQKEGKWFSELCLMRDGQIHKTMLSFSGVGFKTEWESEDAMDNIVKWCIAFHEDKPVHGASVMIEGDRPSDTV